MSNIYTTRFSSFEKSDENQFKICVIDLKYLFKFLYSKATKRQKELYGDPKNHSFIYLNNYAILLDKFFNMYANWQILKQKLASSYEIEKFVLVYDEKIYEYIIDEHRYYYDQSKHKFIGTWEISHRVLQTYYKLKSLLTIAEINKYNIIEDYISKIHPKLFDSKYIDIKSKIYAKPSFAKYKLRNEFFHWVQILQARLSHDEYQELIKLLLNYMNVEKNTRVFLSSCSLIDKYSAAEVAVYVANIKEENKTLLYSDHYVCSKNLYGTKDCQTIRSLDKKCKGVQNINKPSTSRWKEDNKNIWNLWKVANKEFLNYIIDVNRFNTFNIFPPKQSEFSVSMIQYNDNELDEKTWYKITIDAIEEFNKTFKTSLII